MDYHEIGEIFEHDGVLLKVVPSPIYKFDACSHCYFHDTCTHGDTKCTWSTRKDDMNIVFKRIDKCGTPPAEIKTIPKRQIIYKKILDKLFETYKAKDRDYGSAFSEMFDELGVDYAYGKLREKMNRIKVLRNHPNMVENEGLEDALLDTAGYAILTLVELKNRKQ